MKKFALTGVALVAVVALAVLGTWTWGYPSSEVVEASGPDMSLAATGGSVVCNDPDKPTKCDADFIPGNPKAAQFQITVNANVIPDGGYDFFASEVFFGGLAYNQDTCEDEVVWPDQTICPRNVGPGGQVQHSPATGIIPPFEKSNFVGMLVKLDVHCPSEGIFKVALTDHPSSAFGARYDVADVKPIGQQALDLNGDTTSETVDVADTLLINCGSPPDPTVTIGNAQANTRFTALWSVSLARLPLGSRKSFGGQCQSILFEEEPGLMAVRALCQDRFVDCFLYCSTTETKSLRVLDGSCNVATGFCKVDGEEDARMEFTVSADGESLVSCTWQFWLPGRDPLATGPRPPLLLSGECTGVREGSAVGISDLWNATVESAGECELTVIETDTELGLRILPLNWWADCVFAGEPFQGFFSGEIDSVNGEFSLESADGAVAVTGVVECTSMSGTWNQLQFSATPKGVKPTAPCTPTPTHTPTATTAPTPTDTPVVEVLPTAVPPATPTPTPTTAPGLVGDVDCDGTINSVDAALILQYDAGLIDSLSCEENADVNAHGTINSIDAALILQYDAGLICCLPP